MIASSVSEAIQQLRERPLPDLLISDVLTPGGKSGVDMADPIHEIHPGLPIALVSGHADATIAGFGFDVLWNPVSQTALAALVDKHRTLQRSPRHP